MKIRNERGVAIVELAIIMPLLFVILFGIIDFGILLHDKAMLTNASREGARAGVVFNYPARISLTDVEQKVRDYCADHLISFDTGAALNVSAERDGIESGDLLTVTATYPFRFLAFSNLLPLIGGGFEDVLNLSAVTVMRLE